MEHNLKNMSLEELWRLFPITLVPHRKEWNEWADEEIMALSGLMAEFHPEITHIGSTAIEGIMAKPIIDLLAEVEVEADYTGILTLLEANGYICMASGYNRMSFNKGYTPHGYAARVFHIHLRRRGDNAEIGFRNYLNCHADVAREYEALKLSLLPRFRNDRDGYTRAKSEFVERINCLCPQAAVSVEGRHDGRLSQPQ